MGAPAHFRKLPIVIALNVGNIVKNRTFNVSVNLLVRTDPFTTLQGFIEIDSTTKWRQAAAPAALHRDLHSSLATVRRVKVKQFLFLHLHFLLKKT